MEDIYDLIVVGGGPAGASAAITAARGGVRVLLLERGRFPRHKVCGEFVSAESLELLSSLLDSQHQLLSRDAVRISEARMFVDGRMLRSTIDPPAASIARFDLDAALWESATACGVETRTQITINSIAGDGPFRVSTSSGEFNARVVVNASGRWSNLNPVHDAHGTKWIGLKAHFAEAGAFPSVDLYFLEGGYCGVQPLGPEKINACAMVRADVASTLPEVFAQQAELRERSRRWKLMSDPVSTSPLVFRAPQPVRDGMLMAGDAAAFVDPFVGDGISLALRSGAVAGECLLPFFRGEAELPSVLIRYEERYRQQFAPVFRTSSRIRRMLVLPRAIRRPLLFVLQNTPGITGYLVRKTR